MPKESGLKATVGWYLVDDAMRIKVEQWAALSARRLESSPGLAYDSVHLDDLLGHGYARSSAVELALNCTEVLAEAVKEQNYAYRVAVALNSTARLVPIAPNLETIRQQLHELEPPSIYICREIFTMYTPYFEEFRVPLERMMRKGVPILCYYSCFRSVDASPLDQEYTRVVWWDVMGRLPDTLHHSFTTD